MQDDGYVPVRPPSPCPLSEGGPANESGSKKDPYDPHPPPAYPIPNYVSNANSWGNLYNQMPLSAMDHQNTLQQQRDLHLLPSPVTLQGSHTLQHPVPQVGTQLPAGEFYSSGSTLLPAFYSSYGSYQTVNLPYARFLTPSPEPDLSLLENLEKGLAEFGNGVLDQRVPLLGQGGGGGSAGGMEEWKFDEGDGMGLEGGFGMASMVMREEDERERVLAGLREGEQQRRLMATQHSLPRGPLEAASIHYAPLPPPLVVPAPPPPPPVVAANSQQSIHAPMSPSTLRHHQEQIEHHRAIIRQHEEQLRQGLPGGEDPLGAYDGTGESHESHASTSTKRGRRASAKLIALTSTLPTPTPPVYTSTATAASRKPRNPPSTQLPTPSRKIAPTPLPSASISTSGDIEGGPKCSHCEATTTPLWRRGPEEELLCNACGLYLKLHSRKRPTNFSKQVSPPPPSRIPCCLLGGWD